MDGTALEKVYQENLEERIISYLAKQLKITLESAMDIYYRSHLANKIHQGTKESNILTIKCLPKFFVKRKKIYYPPQNRTRFTVRKTWNG